ncbi:hypothetical protein GOV03_04665 [Candidatus Woesearchaeota archaeon]|nr:hypothetical protein [Candidatus Woesearchaeota archaeon]
MYKKGLLVGLVLVAMLAQGCAKDHELPVSEYTVKDGAVILDKEGSLSNGLCTERSLDDKIVVLESKYCGACSVVVPLIRDVGIELGVDITFLDLSESADSLEMKKLRIQPHYTPTMLVGCDVYVGGKSKEEYFEIISKFLE